MSCDPQGHVLFDYVKQCEACDGAGKHRQRYNLGCGMGYAHMMGRCDWCDGQGWVYRGNHKPVPASVLGQIETLLREPKP